MSVLNPETFLELTQRAHQECGIQGEAPDTLVGAIGTNVYLGQRSLEMAATGSS
jgi:hypothetical protein